MEPVSCFVQTSAAGGRWEESKSESARERERVQDEEEQVDKKWTNRGLHPATNWRLIIADFIVVWSALSHIALLRIERDSLLAVQVSAHVIPVQQIAVS